MQVRGKVNECEERCPAEVWYERALITHASLSNTTSSDGGASYAGKHVEATLAEEYYPRSWVGSFLSLHIGAAGMARPHRRDAWFGATRRPESDRLKTTDEGSYNDPGKLGRARKVTRWSVGDGVEKMW